MAAADLEWKEIPEVEGVKVAPVAKNEATKSVAMFIQFPEGFDSGPHRHLSSFHRVTIEGSLSVSVPGEEAPPAGIAGEYFRGIKDLVHGSTSKTGGTIFLVSAGEWGTVMLDAEGNPLPAKGEAEPAKAAATAEP